MESRAGGYKLLTAVCCSRLRVLDENFLLSQLKCRLVNWGETQTVFVRSGAWGGKKGEGICWFKVLSFHHLPFHPIHCWCVWVLSNAVFVLLFFCELLWEIKVSMCLLSHLSFSIWHPHNKQQNWNHKKRRPNLTSNINPLGRDWNHNNQWCCIPLQVDAAKSELACNNPNIAATFADKLKRNVGWQQSGGRQIKAGKVSEREISVLQEIPAVWGRKFAVSVGIWVISRWTLPHHQVSVLIFVLKSLKLCVVSFVLSLRKWVLKQFCGTG